MSTTVKIVRGRIDIVEVTVTGGLAPADPLGRRLALIDHPDRTPDDLFLARDLVSMTDMMRGRWLVSVDPGGEVDVVANPREVEAGRRAWLGRFHVCSARGSQVHHNVNNAIRSLIVAHGIWEEATNPDGYLAVPDEVAVERSRRVGRMRRAARLVADIEVAAGIVEPGGSRWCNQGAIAIQKAVERQARAAKEDNR